MKTQIKKLLAGTAVAVAATAAATPAALAAGSATPGTTTATARSHVASTSPGSSAANTVALLALIKAKAAAAISLRDSALQAAITAVTANQSLTPADKATVLGTLNGDLSGLNTLGPTIQSDPTPAQATADYTAIFLNFRVFALALPQARLAASADDLTGTVVPRLDDAQNRLTALLAGPDSGKDTATVKATMTDLAKQISSITSETNGVAGQVLAYHPADWNGNHAILTAPKASLVAARAAAVQARADIASIVGALK